jgi:hypothetical protein
MLILATLQRAFASNLQTVRCSRSESEKLLAAGVEHSTAQKYYAWRRGVLMFVVICTIVSTGLLTYQTFYETSEQQELLQAIPLFYCIRADIVTRPLTTPASFQSLRIVQVCEGITTTIAGALLLLFFAGIEVEGIRLVGLEPASCLLPPLDMAQLVLETIGKSMFMTVLGADLLMRMNLSAWRNLNNFVGTEEAMNYGIAMERMQRVANSAS